MDGKIGEENIGDIKETLNTVASYGWLLCQGQTLSRTADKKLYDWVVANNLLEQTAGDGKPFGLGDGSTTFTNIDLRETTLKGAGLTGRTVGNHISANGLAVGEFIDDRVQKHKHRFVGSYNHDVDSGSSISKYSDGGSQFDKISEQIDGRSGDTTEVKAVGINYMIKVME